MADADLRRLEREVAISSTDVEPLSKLINAKIRSGEEITIWRKIRHQDGRYCAGVFHYDTYNKRQYFTSAGKTWIKRALPCNYQKS